MEAEGLESAGDGEKKNGRSSKYAYVEMDLACVLEEGSGVSHFFVLDARTIRLLPGDRNDTT